ncbi:MULTISPECIES: hypothetical protein [Bacillaceae]|uniref:Uncharacterized protein n=1 Tax=Mesobacillus boroniphilus TaxID=308892 RepID=A0A944CK65_9BACI|nr:MULTISPECIES: hypothetical protein [Bacillaceae]MBS8263942.1 hypothetical protein [Mesobacillus boroniphilus]MBT2693023.1 hypothetical protein [Bacillus sp. ISL-55]
MRDLLGYFLIAQAIITGVIVYSIQQLSDSIKESAAWIANPNGSLGWGSDLPTFVLWSLIVVAGLGIFLVVKKKSD